MKLSIKQNFLQLCIFKHIQYIPFICDQVSYTYKTTGKITVLYGFPMFFINTIDQYRV
jgi:hypothetical protein